MCTFHGLCCPLGCKRVSQVKGNIKLYLQHKAHFILKIWIYIYIIHFRNCSNSCFLNETFCSYSTTSVVKHWRLRDNVVKVLMSQNLIWTGIWENYRLKFDLPTSSVMKGRNTHESFIFSLIFPKLFLDWFMVTDLYLTKKGQTGPMWSIVSTGSFQPHQFERIPSPLGSSSTSQTSTNPFRSTGFFCPITLIFVIKSNQIFLL